MKQIKIYTSNTCGYCHAAMDYFNEKGLEYEEHNISIDKDAKKELIKMGYMGVPIIFIGDEIIEGFNREKIENALAE